MYVPAVNITLAGATLILTAVFQTSENLALMYGLTITCIMVLTTVLMGMMMRYVYNWRWAFVIPWTCFFLFIDCLWFGEFHCFFVPC